MEAIQQIDRQRIELESNMEKLEKALTHWQTWDAEYEGLKEELLDLEADGKADAIERIATDYGGELLTEKDVSQNIRTISKQIDTARIGLIELEDESGTRGLSEQGLPVSEIIEELDDNDNIISSKVTKPEEVTANILDTLRKAGVKDVPVAPAQDQTIVNDTAAKPSGATSQAKVSASMTGSPAITSTNLPPTGPGQQMRKGAKVKADDSKPVSNTLLQGSFSEKDRVIELDDDDEFIGSTAVLPQDESPEDAQLRREMLNYHLNEVGNVVAEMDILEGDSDDDEFYDELQDLQDSDGVSETSDISDEEDQHGRSLRPVVTEEYRKQMRELERRLNGPAIGNLGPQPNGIDLAAPFKDVPDPEPTIKPTLKPAANAKKENGAKSVRFAEGLDISPAPQSSTLAPQVKQPRPASTLADNVMERSTSETSSPATSSKPAKVSRFKQNRTEAVPSPAEEQPAPPPRDEKTLADAVIERPAAIQAPAPFEPDDLDSEVQRRQLTTEYYRLRNNMIQQQGGFKMTDEDREEPLMEEQEDGKVKKVSRFKAARLQR
ncbi:Hypothetical protein D9617_8g050990 [Elsinoe fawcettii]|nr:Hypothetical protein D9617_8g050990 [Elsinoe fawcettii]